MITATSQIKIFKENPFVDVPVIKYPKHGGIKLKSTVLAQLQTARFIKVCAERNDVNESTSLRWLKDNHTMLTTYYNLQLIKTYLTIETIEELLVL